MAVSEAKRRATARLQEKRKALGLAKRAPLDEAKRAAFYERERAYSRRYVDEAYSGKRDPEVRERILREGRAYRLRIKLRAIEILGGKCRCGFDDHRALEFHHKTMVRRSTPEARRASSSDRTHRLICKGDPEAIAGIELLCSNCHAIESYENGDQRTKVEVPRGERFCGAVPPDADADGSNGLPRDNETNFLRPGERGNSTQEP